jgi:chaperone modulatory protein CbpM
MTMTTTSIEGVVLDEHTLIGIGELTQVCGISTDEVRIMVGEGMLHPLGAEPRQWRFTGIEVRRARRALRLRHDLELNLAGTALALDLLDEIERLRERVECLERYLDHPVDADER